MFRVVPLIVVLGLVGFVTGAVPSDKQPYFKEVVPPWSSDRYTITFEGGEPAMAMVVGDGKSYIGLYVYDGLGNCVAHDDQNVSAARDDLAVTWFPTQTERYWIEVANLGRMPNEYELACR